MNVDKLQYPYLRVKGCKEFGGKEERSTMAKMMRDGTNYKHHPQICIEERVMILFYTNNVCFL